MLLVGIQYCVAQGLPDTNEIIDSMPALMELEMTLTQYTYQERDAQLAAHNRTKTKPWKELLPSIGVGYTAGGSPRPTASWSPLQVMDRKERQNKIINDRESIILSYEVILEDRLHKLRQLYHNYEVDIRIIATRHSTLLIDEELFAITERKYEENIIRPSEYLSAKRDIVRARAEVEVMKLELKKFSYEVLWEARW